MLTSFSDNLQVLVMGASGGIGQAFCQQLSQSDKVKKIYAASRSGKVFDHRKISKQIIDYADERSLVETAKNISQPLDLIINATGFLHDDQQQPEKTYAQISSENFTKNMQSNVLGPALLIKHFMPKLNNKGKSLFAILSARVGSISDNRLGGWYSYRASKAAANMLIKTTAIEVARKNKQAIVIALHPGTVDTNLSQPFQANVPEGKLFTPQFSAEALLKVIDSMSVEDSGLCFAWDGQQIPA